MKILERRFCRRRFSVYDKQVEELRAVLVGIKSGKSNAQLFPLRALGKIEAPAKGLFRIRLEDLDIKTAVFREIFPKGQGIVTNNQTKPTVQPRGLEDGVGVASSEGWPSRYCKTNHKRQENAGMSKSVHR